MGVNRMIDGLECDLIYTKVNKSSLIQIICEKRAG